MAYLPTIDKKVVTTNTTPTLIASIPIAANSAYYIEIRVLSYKTDYTSIRGGRIGACFARGAGNVVRDGTLVNTLAGTLTTAVVTMTANTSTQTADITVTGVLATSITWNLAIDVLINT
jgi:hypothetical protein